MKRRTTFIVLVIFVLAGLCIVASVAMTRQQKIRNKIDTITGGIKALRQRGKSAERPFSLLKDARLAFTSGMVDRGELTLDQAVIALSEAGLTADEIKAISKLGPQKYELPASALVEETIDCFNTPKPLTIDGYQGVCMEPEISGDGQYLYFNDSNAEDINTDIFFAKRVGPETFTFLGKLPGVSAPTDQQKQPGDSKEMAPSLDAMGNLYFTSLRSYADDHKSLYCGKLKDEQLTAVSAVPGDISPHEPGDLNMDCGISHDGTSLIISKARFDIGQPLPSQSDLVIATRGTATPFFAENAADQKTLEKLNTEALEYAPELSKDGLELYFTRASSGANAPDKRQENLRIMLAQRQSINESFAPARVLKSIEGFVEAPTITDDGKELFFHKKDADGKYRIYHATRKETTPSQTGSP